MADTVPVPVTSTPMNGCAACGTWARTSPCPRCGWGRRGEASDPLAIRVLLDFVVADTGDARLVRAWCARLSWLEDDAAFRIALQADAAKPDAAWVASIVARTRAVVREDLSRVYPAASVVPVVVALRLHNQHSGLDLSHLDGPSVHVVPFDAAIADSGRALRDVEVAFDLSDVDLRVRAGQEGPRISVTVARPVLLDEILLLEGAYVVARAAIQREAQAGVAVAVALPEATSSELRRLQSDPTSWGLGLRVVGREEPVRVPLPADFARSLPDGEADLFLHPGTVSTRFCLLGSGTEVWQSLSSPEAVRTLGLPTHLKTADPVAFAEWIDGCLRPLAAWAQRTRGLWLRRVVVAAPGDRTFAKAAGSRGPEAQAVLLGNVTVVPEYTALAAHVIPALSGIAGVLQAHRKEHESAVRLANARLAGWASQKRQSENPVLGLVISKPGPQPDPPPAFESLGIAEEWLETLLERGPRGTRLVLLDIGGTNVDGCFLLGGTDDYFRLEGAGSERVTQAPESEWETLTREVYDAALKLLVVSIRMTLGEAPVLIVGSGGGLRNPWFRERLDAAFVAAGFPFAPMVDASVLVRVAQTIRDRGLDATGLTRFLAVHERDGGVPGRFDVVDGLRGEDRR